jgi:hypothetical protein
MYDDEAMSARSMQLMRDQGLMPGGGGGGGQRGMWSTPQMRRTRHHSFGGGRPYK